MSTALLNSKVSDAISILIVVENLFIITHIFFLKLKLLFLYKIVMTRFLLFLKEPGYDSFKRDKRL